MNRAISTIRLINIASTVQALRSGTPNSEIDVLLYLLYYEHYCSCAATHFLHVTSKHCSLHARRRRAASPLAVSAAASCVLSNVMMRRSPERKQPESPHVYSPAVPGPEAHAPRRQGAFANVVSRCFNHLLLATASCGL